uniref:DBF4-type domain-containing protein n=1 Tax=Anopheles merus TaxID=30066 RepID=A0A182V1T3_ANOME
MLGFSVEFFLNKDVTHFVTDKLQPTAAVGETGEQQREQPPYCASPSGVVSSAENPARPPHQRQPAPLPPLQRTSRQLLHLTHQQQTHGQYVNDYGPATSRTSSPCPPPITSAAAAAAPSSSAGACITTVSGAAASAQQKHVVAGPAAVSSSTTAASVGFDGKAPSPSCYSPSGAAITRTSAAANTAASRQNSPVHQARSWGTLIWSAEYALKFLRKVLASLPQAANGVGDSSKAGRLGGDGRTDASGRPHRHHHRHHQSHGARPAGSQHVHHLRGRFVKIESRSAPGNHRPVYQEFKRWPVLLLTDRELAGRKAPFADVHEAPERKQQPVDEQRRKGNVTHETGGGGVTPVEGTSTSRMTRKLASAANNSVATRTTTTATGKSGETVVKKRAQDKAAAPPRDCGYCEICRIEYDSLAAHVQSESHQTFVQNDDNFLSLDRLLDSLGGGGDSDETKLAEEEDGYDGGEGGGPGGAVAVETFFQQLHSTTRIKRGPGEELLYERRKPPASPAAPQPKAIVGAGGGGAGGDKRQEEKEEEDGAEGRRIKATTVTVAVTTTTTAAADELIERQQQNTTAPIGEEGEQEARRTQVAATVRQALEEEKPAKIATSKEGDDGNSEERKGQPRAKVKRKRTTTTSTSTGADCEEEKCEGKDKHGDKDKKALIRLAIQSVIATFDCSDGFLAEADQTLDDSVRLDDSVVVGKKEEKESVKEQADKSPAVGESVSDKRAANSSSSSSRVSVTNRDSSGKKKEEELVVGQRTSRVRSCKQQTEAATAEVSVRRSERKPSGSAFREVREEEEEEEEKEKVLSKPAEEPEAASGEGMFGRRSAIHHHPHNQLNHHNHQKHKSTLSALLLKQQQERAQQQQQEKEKQQQWDERKATDSAAVLDHAAGMKVITDFRTKQQQQQQQQQEAVEDDGELVAHKSVLLVGVPATEAIAPAATEDARPEETGTPKTGAGRRKRNPQRAEEDATSMGLKASTTASMNKHHHHHHHHLSESGSGGGAGTKTRHATELAATLLECDGLDPKNTKRISLGLRQNPKRANLNEDFTSLLDETLERSKMSGSSTSVRRTAQSRIRVGPKAKEQHTVVVTPKQQQVEEEPPNRVCEDEAKEAHDRLKPAATAAAAAGSNKRSSGSAKKTVTLEDIKVRGIRWRAPSPMTRPPVKSPLLYKVIDNQAGGEETVSSSGGISTSRPTATTTTATGLQASQRKDPTATGGSAQLPSSAQSRTTCKASKVNGASPGKKNGLIVKIRRVRQSELSLLNDEAENFMFPRKDDSSSDEETDDGRQTSSEGYQGGSANNYSVDITSSSEADRGMATEDATTNEMVMANHSEEDEDEEAAATREEEKRTVAGGGGGRKRKKAIPATAQRACSIESSDHRSSPVSSRSSPTLPIASKRARLETAARRKAQQTADFGKGQDPVDARVRFPEAPIQPCPVAEAAKTSPSSTDRARRRRRSQSSASEDGQQHDDDEDDDASNDDAAQVEEKDEKEEEQEEEEVKKVVVKSRRGRGAGMRGRRGQRKAYREDSVTSTFSATATIGPCPACSIAKGRGRGRRGGVAGRRGRRGAGRAARGSRLQAGGAASCNCHLLDASRMPPPSSRRRTDESVERAATPASPRKAGTRASKTKTTPPSAVSSSSFTSSYGGDGAAMMAGASHSSYIKGKEDGMGAVFKWINFRKRCEEIEPYRFAFERVPSLEPWYETFQRQDDGTEKVYEYFGSTGYRKLPYEMGPLPALGQNCCILNYKVVPASRKSNRTTSLQSCSSASLEPSSPGGRKSSRPSSSDVQQSFGGAASTADEPTESKKCSPSSSLSSLPLKKRKLLLQESSAGTDGSGSSKTDAGGGSGSSAATAAGEASSNSSRIARLIAGANERPRKSPREHASTLAILSLLQQQQHRKRAGTIKILTSPRKATTATATQTTALHEQLLHQEVDSNGEEPSRSCSRASDRASSRAGSSTGGIKFDRPLFPDSSYVNSRTLCQELDAFLSDELKRVTGSKEGCTTLGAIVKQERSDTGEAEVTDERVAIDETADKSETLLEEDDLMDQELLLPPSVVQEGIAIERNELPVSKRDLLDVLQTVGTEPPLSLKLVQRCESVVKKIVQYDRKERPMVASGTGSGLAISSGSPVIGLQLFDSGSPLAACGPGSGPGSVGGTFLKKRINRTGWPTNKRKIGTRTRQQSRFMLPSSLTGGKKSLSRESIKKEPEEQRGEEKEEEEEEDGSLSQQKPQQCAIKAEESLQRHAETEEEEEEEEDNEEQDEGEDNDDEADEEEEEEEHEDEDDDADTVVEEKIRPARGGGASRKDVAQANHKKTDSVRRKQREDDHKEETRANHTPAGRRGRKRSVGVKRGVAKRDHINAAATCGDEHDDDDDEQAKEALAATTCEKRPTEKDRSTTMPGPTVDTMPTLRAALMRDNSQLQRLLSSPSSKPPAFSSASPSSILAPGSLNRGTVPFTTTPGRGTAATAGGENVPCPPTSSAPSSGPVLGVNSCKYVTKTTTTMTRVDYDGGGGGPSPPKRKHSREDVAASNEQEEHHLPKEDARQKQQTGGVTNRHRSSVALATHDSDDKECDSISSRSIFVSDDCDTTSSSTAINPPDERPPSTSELPSGPNDPATVPSAPSQTNPRLPAIRVRRKESSDNEETIHSAAATEEEEEVEEEHSVNVPLTSTTTNKAPKSPRTPSERIRNKMVKNRRAAVRADQTAKGRAGCGGRKRPPAKKHHDVQIRAASSSKRRKSSSLGPPLPPPSMMPLSPPLTTSTSSSSSSSYGADDKAPLSPAPAKAHDCESIEEEEEQQHTTTTTAEQYSSRAKAGEAGVGGVVLTPSKIKTRSSTFGYSPPKRTYGAGKQTPKKLPFVSLIKANFVQSAAEATAAAEVTLVNGKKAVDGNSTGKGNRRRKAEEKKPRKPSTSPSGRKPSGAGGRKKKDSEPVADDVAVAGSGVGGTTDGKRSKKLTLKAKQLLARKRLPKAVEEQEEEAQEEDDEVATELEEVDEEEHYELLEVEEVEEEEDDGDDGADGGAETEHLHRDEEETFPAGEAQRYHHHHHNHHHHRQQARREDEKRKLVMADHDYSDQPDDTDPPILTFTSSGGTSTVVMTSSGMGTAASTSSSTTTKSTFNSPSPNKYSPRKLRKPRGRWYRER